MRKKGIIRITLKSDLCMASGYSFDGIIDTDICYDRFGIPYIPAKRLKGCLRETGESVLYSVIPEDVLDDLLGKWGTGIFGGIVIGNAVIQGYDKVSAELEKIEAAHGTVVSPQKVLDRFCHIQAQTQMKEGVADDNTLRYTRVLNRISPIDRKELVFEAEVSFDPQQKLSSYDMTAEEVLGLLVKGTRNIGLKRNRGLGSVSCELVNCVEESAAADNRAGSGEETVTVSYVLRNTEPLMLSERSDTESVSYIKGQTIAGTLAGKYLSIAGNSADDEAFADLFLNGQTIISDAVPYKNGRAYYPAPLFVNKLKKSPELVNTIEKIPDEITNDGNQPKKLKGAFVWASENYREADVAEVDKEIMFHHSKKGRKNGRDDEVLFSFEVIRTGQEFCGEVTTKKKYEKLVEALLTDGTFSLGKSRTAQYGLCEVTVTEKAQEKPAVYAKGERVVITLLSDLMVHNGMDYTIIKDEVVGKVASELGIEGTLETSFIQTKEAVGYLSVWNMRKAPVPVVAAGSAFVFKLERELNISKNVIGERTLEGYGHIRVDRCPDAGYAMKKTGEVSDAFGGIILSECRDLVKDICKTELEKEMLLDVITEEKIKVTSSKIGRVTLMLRESLDENKNDFRAALAAFRTRIASIKTDSDRKVFQNVLKKAFRSVDGENLDVDRNKIPVLDEMIRLGFSEDETVDMVDSLWGKYVMTSLVNQKYNKKGVQ